MNNQEKYNEFIAGIIPFEIKINLPVAIKHDNKIIRATRVFGGVTAKKVVKIKIIDYYSRSLNLIISFEDKKETLLVFCPLNKSPEEFLSEMRHKISLKVGDSYPDEKLIEFESEAKLKFREKLKGAKVTKIKEL